MNAAALINIFILMIETRQTAILATLCDCTKHVFLFFYLALNKVQLRLMGFILQIFSHKPKHWTNYNFDQIVPEEKSSGTMNVYAKCYVSPANRTANRTANSGGPTEQSCHPWCQDTCVAKKKHNFYIFQPPNPQMIVFV